MKQSSDWINSNDTPPEEWRTVTVEKDGIAFSGYRVQMGYYDPGTFFYSCGGWCPFDELKPFRWKTELENTKKQVNN